jgi:hypothetical protein
VERSVIDVGVYFSRGDRGMPENRLQASDVDFSVLVHKCCRRVAKLMRGVALRVESCLPNVFFDDVLDGAIRDPFAESRNKHRVAIVRDRFNTVGEIVTYGGDTGAIQIDRTLFPAFPQDNERVFTPVGKVDTAQLGQSHPERECNLLINSRVGNPRSVRPTSSYVVYLINELTFRPRSIAIG